MTKENELKALPSIGYYDVMSEIYTFLGGILTVLVAFAYMIQS